MKLVLIATLGVAIGAFFIWDLDQYLTLEQLQRSKELYSSYYDQTPLVVLSSFFLLYVAVTALSLPGAAVMTLAAGALFEITVGTIVVSFASTIGATLAALVARFLLSDYLEQKFQEQLQTINQKIATEGAFYLFTLRLIPAFPFFVINLVMGLTRLPLRTFFWVSQVGMLPGTILYVNAGSQLSKIDSLSGILSPNIIFSFILIGIFPLIVKRLLRK